jgi:hypothetical protein
MDTYMNLFFNFKLIFDLSGYQRDKNGKIFPFHFSLKL